MLLLIILSTLFSSSIAQPRPPANLIANLAGDAAQAIPEGAVANAIPQEMFTNDIRPFMQFDEAIRLKDVFRWNEVVIVRHYSKIDPERVKDYIFRELDNTEISEATRLRLLDIFLADNLQFFLRTFASRDMEMLAQIGHERMVNAILNLFLNSGRGAEAYNLALGAVSGSVRGDRFRVFQVLIDILSVRMPLHNMLQLLQRAFIGNSPHHYVEYGLNGIRNHLRTPGVSAIPENWYDALMGYFINAERDDVGQRLETFRFLLRQPEWNPGTISNLLDTVLNCFENGMSRFTSQLLLELRNPLRTFQNSYGNQINGGIDALSSAILEARSDPRFHDLVDLLVHQRQLLDA
jgi:hypothetical protein